MKSNCQVDHPLIIERTSNSLMEVHESMSAMHTISLLVTTKIQSCFMLVDFPHLDSSLPFYGPHCCMTGHICFADDPAFLSMTNHFLLHCLLELFSIRGSHRLVHIHGVWICSGFEGDRIRFELLQEQVFLLHLRINFFMGGEIRHNSPCQLILGLGKLLCRVSNST
jgi:hypothetical protein